MQKERTTNENCAHLKVHLQLAWSSSEESEIQMLWFCKMVKMCQKNNYITLKVRYQSFLLGLVATGMANIFTSTQTKPCAMQHFFRSEVKWHNWSFGLCPNDLARLNSVVMKLHRFTDILERSRSKFSIVLQDIITALTYFHFKKKFKNYERTEVVHRI